MQELLGNLFLGSFWTRSSEWLHILIVLAYYLIPLPLVYSLYKGRDVPFHWMFLIFGTFFVVCGTNHVMEIWKLWYPQYWLSDFMKAITAIFCVSTTLLLLALMPFALALPSPAKLEAANLALSKEITQRLRVEEALSKLALELEKRVEERTVKLKLVNLSLKQEIHVRHTAEAQLREQTTKLEIAMQKLQQTQAQLIQTEKMSALGQLVAGVAHEINNPINFIYGNIAFANQYTQNLLHLLHLYQQHYPQPIPEIQAQKEAIDLNFLVEDLPKILSSMQMGTERIRQIVLSLRNFSRFDQSELKSVNIHEGIDSTLLILQHRLKAYAEYSGIQIIKNYGELPLVECYAGQLNQVFMNILSNAIEALEEQRLEKTEQLPITNYQLPTICIRTEVLNGERVAIRIADNGLGMTEEIRHRLFDPFFTTKPIGKGTGLGLSISHCIVVEKHGGKLQCFSAPSEGAEFVIEIPIRQHYPQLAT